MEVIGARRLLRRLVAISLAAAILGGCANPYIKLDAPDYSKARESPTPLPVAIPNMSCLHRCRRCSARPKNSGLLLRYKN